jgi:hypothetical protein
MHAFTTVKVFDFSDAPAELQNTVEATMLRPPQGESDALLIAVWVGTRSSSLEQPIGASERPKVTAWEHGLHKWLRRSGADIGDVVLLSWGGLAVDLAAAERTAESADTHPRTGAHAKQPAVH